eukprot:m.248600 g.248600  ORF g.248600 m.248600 type:complete len:535 (+) comp15768_c0_seq1:20-1624(+)
MVRVSPRRVAVLFAVLVLAGLVVLQQRGRDVVHAHEGAPLMVKSGAEPLPPSYTSFLDYVEEIPSRRSDDAYAMNAFNVHVSDKLPTNRAIPDTRPPDCASKSYLFDLPRTSVIITFHNEARSTLYRSVRSILDRTPERLLEEIILIDDASIDPEQGKIVVDLPKVRLLRNTKREGLIRSRVKGANEARGEVLTFLDSHVECNVDWVTPLLHTIAQNRSTIASPIIDVIDMDNFAYLQTEHSLRGGFSWDMQFTWERAPDRGPGQTGSISEPMPTPTIAGGLFSIDRQFFFDSGAYDLAMDIWGGENLEISFRTWMCGGRMLILPCSRVGHIFRKHHPYAFPEGGANTYNKNTARVAEVWMDEFKEHFYSAKPSARGVAVGSLMGRKALRNRLHCKSFEWFLKTVYPELKIPGQPAANPSLRGMLRVPGGKCLTTKFQELAPLMADCHGASYWTLTSSQRLELLDGRGQCLSAHAGALVLQRCSDADVTRWRRRDVALMADSHTCLDAEADGHPGAALCRRTPSQAWIFGDNPS